MRRPELLEEDQYLAVSSLSLPSSCSNCSPTPTLKSAMSLSRAAPRASAQCRRDWSQRPGECLEYALLVLACDADAARPALGHIAEVQSCATTKGRSASDPDGDGTGVQIQDIEISMPLSLALTFVIEPEVARPHPAPSPSQTACRAWRPPPRGGSRGPAA